LAALAHLASESARRHADLKGKDLAPLEAVARETGALGFAMAHTGSAGALLFAPGKGAQADALRRLRAIGHRDCLRFTTES